MGMPLPHTDWTVEMVNALPDDGNRYEVIDGALLVTPAPSDVHQRAVWQLIVLLDPYVKKLRLDGLSAPSSVTFSRRSEVQPDVLVRPPGKDGRPAARFSDVGVLLLAVEVLSPQTKRTDRGVKRVLYQGEAVRDYWIVDIDARTIERWTPTSLRGEVFVDEIQWQPLDSHEPFVLDVAGYFRAVFWE